MEIDKKMDAKINYIELNKGIFFTTVKRFIDIFVSIVALILLIPIFTIIALLIKIDNPKGYIFFSQERVGTNQEIFKMYKFRSMYNDAEQKLENLLKYNEIDGAMFKLKKDPRVTKIGKYLRAYSLDELPQLLNVIKGDMSLVGPRPPLVREVEKYTNYDKQRLLVKPGISGLWQVSGRNSLSFEQMVELDLKYIKESSIGNDIKILFKTVIVVIKKENAY